MSNRKSSRLFLSAMLFLAFAALALFYAPFLASQLSHAIASGESQAARDRLDADAPETSQRFRDGVNRFVFIKTS